MKNTFFIWRENRVFLLLAAITIVLQYSGADLAAWLRFDREAIQAGQFWRLITGNVLHLGSLHLLLNLTALALIAVIGRNLYSELAWILLLFFSLLGTGVGLYLFSPSTAWYVGLSGALHGLILAMCLAILQQQRGIGILLALIVVGKIAWEQWQGAIPFTDEFAGGPVVVDAHLYGGFAGFLTALICTWWHRKTTTTSAL